MCGAVVAVAEGVVGVVAAILGLAGSRMVPEDGAGVAVAAVSVAVVPVVAAVSVAMVAVVLLDVVMARADAGLALVKTIRQELRLAELRIMLRTRQPGYAPESETIPDCDYNDYKTTTQLTRNKLSAT